MGFLKSLFSDEPGISFGRLATFIALLAVIVWVTKIVWHTNALPALDGVTLFAVSFYGTGKLLGKGAQLIAGLTGKDAGTTG
jgi:hypothetical protein